MDLTTIRKKIDSGSYRRAARPHEKFSADIRLVWSNCKLYNNEMSEVVDWANEFSELFEIEYNTEVLGGETMGSSPKGGSAKKRKQNKNHASSMAQAAQGAVNSISPSTTPTAKTQRKRKPNL